MEQGYHLSQQQVGTCRVMEQVIAPVSVTGGSSQGNGAGIAPVSVTGENSQGHGAGIALVSVTGGMQGHGAGRGPLSVIGGTQGHGADEGYLSNRWLYHLVGTHINNQCN